MRQGYTKIRVTASSLPYVGKRGTVKELPDRDANVLVILGKVERVTDEPQQPAKEPEPQPKTDDGHNRRDMVPEKSPARRRGARTKQNAA